MVNVAQKNRFATTGGQIGVGFLAVHHNNVLQLALSNLRPQLLEFLLVNLRCIHFSRSPEAFRCRSEEHTSELQSHSDLVCRLLLEKKKKNKYTIKINKKKL